MRWGWAMVVVLAACGGAAESASAPKHASSDLRDSDGDGTLDNVDECPADPEDNDGFQDEDGCPDPDNDRDGVPDVSDKCMNNAAGSRPDPARLGCPLSTPGPNDHDGDGNFNATDKCPDGTAEDYDGFQDADGCEDEDNDGDGVDDFFDLCPNQPAGPRPSAKRYHQGCPAAPGEPVGRPIPKRPQCGMGTDESYGYEFPDCPKKK